MEAKLTMPVRFVVRYLSRDPELNVVPVAGNRAAEASFSDRRAMELFVGAVKRAGGQVFDVLSRNWDGKHVATTDARRTAAGYLYMVRVECPCGWSRDLHGDGVFRAVELRDAHNDAAVGV